MLLGLHLLLLLHLLVLLHRELLLLLEEQLVIHARLLLLLLLAILHLLLIPVALFVRLLHNAELLLAHLEVDVLALLDLAINPVDLELVGVDLRLVVLQLGDHFLELLSALFEVDLVFAELLSDVWTALFGENVLQLDIEFLFLLNQDILLRNLLSLRN